MNNEESHIDPSTSGAPTGEAPPTENLPVPRGKVFAGVVVAVAVMVGLYFINREWIAPVAMREAQAKGMAAAGGHPPAPDFSLTGIDGQKVSLADYQGKVLMVDFWATWCGPCVEEIPGFVALQDRYRDQGFTIIGISQDDGPEPVREFYKQYRLNYPVVMGTDDVSQLYGGIIGLPTTFLVGRDGRIYAKHTGTTDISVFEDEIKTLLAAKPGSEVTDFSAPASPTSDEIEVKTPAQVKAESNSDVPGLDLTGLSTGQISQLKADLSKQPCNCGCNMSALDCRHKDPGCTVSRKLAKAQMDKLSKKAA